MTVSTMLEKMNRVNAMTDRVKKRKDEYLVCKEVQICAERGRLLTTSFKETEGQPTSIKYAKAFKKYLQGIPIVIRDGELIVGSQTKYVRGCYPYTEFEPEVVLKDLSGGNRSFSVSGPSVKGIVSEEDARELVEDALYWKDKSVCSNIRGTLQAIWGDNVDEFTKTRMWTTGYSAPPAGKTINHSKVLEKGLCGIMKEIEEEFEHQKEKTFSRFEVQKNYNLQAMRIACQAVIDFSKRYARLSAEMAAKERDPKRKAELEEIAEICERVPEKPARNFREAMQSFWLIYICRNLETMSNSEAPGRFDQYMYPYYERDIREGRLSRQDAAELIGLLLVKFVEMECYKEQSYREFTQGSHIINLTIGGQTRDGRDATNELSYLILHSDGQVRVPSPHISLRYHKNTDPQFMMKGIETNVKIGAGIPAFFNDEVAIPGLVECYGVPLETARNWAPQGCVERYIDDESSGYRQPSLNLTGCLQLALNNGVDLVTGKQVGSATGDPRKFASYEEVYQAFQKQFIALCDAVLPAWNVAQAVRAETYRMPFNSALLDDCIRSGMDGAEGGMKWPQFTGNIILNGYVDVDNSLAAIKKLVFEDKKVCMAELMDALRSDFKGREDLRLMLLSAPKFGNDDDFVDTIASEVWDWTGETLNSYTTVWGSPYHAARQGITLHYHYGKVTGALPSGRKAFEPLTDGSLSPMRGTDVKGPTAVINSASKMDALHSEATLLNQKINPSVLATESSRKKFISLIKTYFDKGGYHIQWNMINRDTLLGAKKHPEKYRDLLVRVAGYSAFFVELAPEVQDEIIGRTEQTI